MAHGHVKFNDAIKEENAVQVEKINDNSYFSNLGFLQDQHIYTVHLGLPKKLESRERAKYETSGDFAVEHASIIDKNGLSEAQLQLKLVDVHGQVQTKVSLVDIDPAVSITLKASVLKSYDGTPSLKRGINLVTRLDMDDASSIASGLKA